MEKYNKQDVELLEKVYLKLRPWATGHPNLAIDKLTVSCPKCESTKIQWRGTQKTLTKSFKRFQCTDCGAWGRERLGKSIITQTV